MDSICCWADTLIFSPVATSCSVGKRYLHTLPISLPAAPCRRAFGKFLALAEAEDHAFELVVLENRAAQNSVRRRLGFFCENCGIIGKAMGDATLELLEQQDRSEILP